jgi:diguanylate cyclase (GGDEF)-like protein
MSSSRKLAVAGGAVAMAAMTIALGALAGIGIWLVAVVGGGLLGIIATLTVVAANGGSQGTVLVRPRFDDVTELPDLAQLELDLGWALNGSRHTLFVYALDGFKTYNDAYGQQTGDALLAWLGRKLREAVAARATVYRRPGASFAVLVEGTRQAAEAVRADATAALFEIGDGFAIWCSGGAVLLPDEASTPQEAIERADRRAHSPLAESGVDIGPAAPSDPIEAMPSTWPHFDVGELAKQIGIRLGVAPERLDVLEAAAHLRDVGNVALPSAVVTNPGALPGYERAFVALHTIVGERLIAGRFGMDDVATIVRSSHERWDGSGYPHRLRGDAIPLESRIVFACSAYQDMTSERPHRHALSIGDALCEVERSAGSQFDPAVARALVDELSDADGDPRASGTGLSAVLSALRSAGSQEPPQGRPLRVLVSDPDPVTRFLLARGIGCAGHECVAVPDGLNAWETYQRALPDVVIAGGANQRLDGIELCERIRADESQTYAVVLADNDDEELMMRAASADVDGFLRKPVMRRDLEVRLSCARQALRARGPRAAAG